MQLMHFFLHLDQFSDQMAQLCLSTDYSDVTFIVQNRKLPAHRVILAARSEYFRALLYGGLSESHQTEIELDVPYEAFTALIKFIYSGKKMIIVYYSCHLCTIMYNLCIIIKEKKVKILIQSH